MAFKCNLHDRTHPKPQFADLALCFLVRASSRKESAARSPGQTRHIAVVSVRVPPGHGIPALMTWRKQSRRSS